MITVSAKVYLGSLLVIGGSFAWSTIRLRFARRAKSSDQGKWLFLALTLMVILLGIIWGLKVDPKTVDPFASEAPAVGVKR